MYECAVLLETIQQQAIQKYIAVDFLPLGPVSLTNQIDAEWLDSTPCICSIVFFLSVALRVIEGLTIK